MRALLAAVDASNSKADQLSIKDGRRRQGLKPLRSPRCYGVAQVRERWAARVGALIPSGITGLLPGPRVPVDHISE